MKFFKFALKIIFKNTQTVGIDCKERTFFVSSTNIFTKQKLKLIDEKSLMMMLMKNLKRQSHIIWNEKKEEEKDIKEHTTCRSQRKKKVFFFVPLEMKNNFSFPSHHLREKKKVFFIVSGVIRQHLLE